MKRNLLKVAAFLFAAVVSVSAMAQTVALQEPIRESADTYEKKGDYQLVNQWIRSTTAGNYTKTDLGGSGLVRGIVAKDGKMYFCYRGGIGTHSIIVVDGVTGAYEKTIILSENAFTKVENEGTDSANTVSAVLLPNNDIKLDSEGNFLVGPIITSANQPMMIYKVDIETGECTELINEVIANKPEYADLNVRFDAFGVWGDVEDYAVVMAMNANAMNAFRWVIEDGVAGAAELVTLDPLYEGGTETSPGTAPQIMPISEDLFYVDGNATFPTLYQYADGKGTRIDCFYDAEGNSLPILGTMNPGHNGITYFQLTNAEGETEYFMCCAATNTAKDPRSSFAIIKYADESLSFQTAELIYQFPSEGFGGQSNAYRTAPAFATENPANPNAADIYVYVGENGFARYTFSCDGADIDVDVDVYFNINLSCNSNQGTVIGSGEYSHGENVTIEAVAKEGYHFVKWSDGNTNATRTITVTENITLTAEFAVALTIHVETPGTLSDLIFDAGKRPVEVAKLTVTGTLNDDDFKLMRETMTSLVDVDLSGITNTSGVNFKNHSNLQSIILPNGLTKIDDDAFYYCSSLTSVTIPNSVTSIGYSAFFLCGSLTSITIPNNVTYIGNGAFQSCSSLTSITIPNNVTYIEKGAFQSCTSLTSITIPNSVTSIGESAFEYCRSLTSIIIPNSVTSIGKSAFEDCESLTSITIPNSVTWIDYYAFGWCDDLKIVTLGNGLEAIDNDAFGYSNIDTIICMSANTPSVAECNGCSTQQAFSSIDPQTCVLKVPAMAYDSYVRHSIWGAFLNIEIMDIDYYKITATANDSEMGEVKGAKYYLPNDTVKLEAIPLLYIEYQGWLPIYYQFKQWSDGSTENPRVFVATEDVTLTAEFIFPPCEVTLACDETQGTVTGGGEYERGTQVTITAQPNIGYKFSHWECFSEEYYSWAYLSNENPDTLEITSQFYDIRAIFEQAKVEVDGVYYYLNEDNTAYVTSPDGDEYYGDIVIPETITVEGNTYTITTIGSSAFGGSNITSVNIPASIKLIRDMAFANCNSLQIVKFNNSTTPPTFEWDVFYNGYYNNKKIIVPCGAIETYENVLGTSEYWYFTDAQYMISVSANNENCYAEIQDNISCDDNQATIYASSYSDNYLFKQWSDGSTENPRIITVTSDTTIIAEFAPCYVVETYYNGEQGVVIGGNKYTAGDSAILIATAFDGYDFDYWEIYSLELVETYWGTDYQYVYQGTSTNDTITFVVDKNYAYQAYFKVVPVLIDGVYYELKNNSTAYVYPYEYTGDIVIPSSVVYKDKNYDVAQIYEDAFTGTSITSLSVSNGLNSINLSGCDSLVALTGNIDFINSCSGLTSLKELKEIYVTSGTLATGDVVYFNFLNLLQIPTLEVLDLSKVENTELSPEMFKETYLDVISEYYPGRIHLSLKNLRKLVLPEGLTMIHDRQFEGLWMLEEIVIPDGVTEIPDGAFYDCHALAKVELNENLTSIGNYAFYSCHALENIVIPDGVTEIGDAAFYGCNYADEIVIASSVQRIGNNAFALCNQVERMEVHAIIPPSIKAKTFYQVNRDIEFVVPTEARNAYAEDIYWREFIQKTPTDIDATNTDSFVVYTQGGMLYIEGVETDYNIFDASGRLIYTGRESALSLPRGVYVVVVGDEVEKVVL